ncbi:MAG: hypothetical protein LBC64_03135 [Fibromonadaceae bacterium]|nr:hypothetical protein [Fibromonadaceae bacterium]
MRALRLTPRQRFLHGFMEYIHEYIRDDLVCKAIAHAEKKRLAKEKRRLARERRAPTC